MTAQMWMPGAVRLGTDTSGGTLVDGPPRCTWHITWDKLDPRPTFKNVAQYLISMGYEPTVQWDPFTGDTFQFLPANRSAKALKNHEGGVETNRLGRVHVQIEAYFTPGMIVDGVKYDQLTDTPMLGLSDILDWTDQLGIPRYWATPRGSRSISDWLHVAGHRAHYNVPENDHTDIVGADVRKLLMLDTPKPSPTGDFVMDAETTKQMRDLLQKELRTVLGNPNSDTDADNTHDSLADIRRDLRTIKKHLGI